MGNGLVSPIYRHHLTSIHFNRILFPKTKRDPNHLTQKRTMQLHLRCLPHKSRHKLVVQLRHMLLVQVFFNGHESVPHANDMYDQTSEKSYENGSMTFYQMKPLKADL